MRRKQTVQEIVFQTIIESMSKGVIPWRKTWRGNAPMNFVTKKAYRGLNRLLLGATPYDSPYFLTFKQCQELGGQVLKGEHASLVVFYKKLDPTTEEREEEQPTVEETTKKKTSKKSKAVKERRYTAFMMRYYKVFNLQQTTLWDKEKVKELTESFAYPEVEEVIEGYTQMPKVNRGNPSYSPSQDLIRMPNKTDFDTPEDYYQTLFHEVAHSTGHEKRLDRGLNGGVDKVKYSYEELVAEISSAFMMSHCGQTFNVENTASYLDGWVSYLKDRKTELFRASASADKVLDYFIDHQVKSVKQRKAS